VNLEIPKLLRLDQAVERRQDLRSLGRRVVLTNGVFDLLHTGHLHSLQAAAALGDALFVCINSDASVKSLKGPLRPIQAESERAYALAALACVDTVLIFGNRRLDGEIRALRPDFYSKAGDYTRETLDPGELAALDGCGAQIRFMPFLEGYSTTRLIERIRAAGSVS
jgi:rfaE bifunctional protein nucleotidyltransferase chain/domain